MKNYMFLKKFSTLPIFLILLVLLNSCGNNFFRGADARKVSPDPRERVKKITIRFLSNEIRSDAIDINVFYKKCDADYKCVVQKNNENIESELRREILKKASIYQKQTKAKNKSFYPGVKMGKD